MRLTLATLEDFTYELSREAARGRVWQKEVFVRVDRAPEQEPAISFLMAIWGTAAIRSEDGDYLMEYGAVCGSDEPRAPDRGTDESKRQEAAIVAVAKTYGLTVRRGKLEII